MPEWTQERPTEPGFWWNWHYATKTVVPAITYTAPEGLRVFFADATGSVLLGDVDDIGGPGCLWSRMDPSSVPAPPPAALPAWERVLRRRFDINSPLWRDITEEIREEEERTG